MSRFLAVLGVVFGLMSVAAVAASAQTSSPSRFDARDPASLVAVLNDMGVKAEISRTVDEDVFLKVVTPAFGFNVQFTGCDRTGKACSAFAFATVAEQRKATLSQINSFNQTSLTCRAYQDQAGKPHVMYAALTSPRDTREELRTHVGVWQGCLASFGAFLNDPAGYLASAP